MLYIKIPQVYNLKMNKTVRFIRYNSAISTKFISIRFHTWYQGMIDFLTTHNQPYQKTFEATGGCYQEKFLNFLIGHNFLISYNDCALYSLPAILLILGINNLLLSSNHV